MVVYVLQHNLTPKVQQLESVPVHILMYVRRAIVCLRPNGPRRVCYSASQRNVFLVDDQLTTVAT